MRKPWPLVVVALVAAALGAGRPASARGAEGPSIASVNVSLSPAALPADGRSRSTVLATVSPPLPGIVVRFGTSGDASLSSASAPTDVAGHATSVLTASTTPGSQTVTASTALGSGQATLTESAIHAVSLRAPAAGIDVPVVPVGLTSQGAMEAPEGPPGDLTWREAFWLRSTSVPGTPGTAALSGHLDDTLGRPAAFWNLSGLRPGDTLLTLLSDGELVRFRVTEVGVYTTQAVNSAPFAARFYGNRSDGRAQGVSHLNLMTCTGSFRGGQGFDHRFVVFADRVG
jgi:Sortase domain